MLLWLQKLNAMGWMRCHREGIQGYVMYELYDYEDINWYVNRVQLMIAR